MISEDSLAAAQIAQIFGSELLKAQQNARTDGGSMPNFVTVDPKQFLVNSNSRNTRAQQSQIIEMLQREAEMAYPLPQPSVAQSVPPLQMEPETPISEAPTVVKRRPPSNSNIETSGAVSSVVRSSLELSLDKIGVTLEKMLGIFEQINDKIKSK